MIHLKKFNESAEIDEKYNDLLAKRLQYNLERYFIDGRYKIFADTRSRTNVIHFTIFTNSLLDDSLNKEKLDIMYKYLQRFDIGNYKDFVLKIEDSKKFLIAIKNKFVEVEMDKYNL